MVQQGSSNGSTIHSLREALFNEGTSLKDEVSSFLEVINEKNPDLNIFIETYGDEALERAGSIDEKVKSGKAGKLAGAVIGLKDNICFKGHKVSAASRILDGFESTFNATVVERLLAEDAIIIGRLNCDEFAMGSSNENSHFGVTRNPLDREKVPGGSSGASAAAVIAGMCNAALGSDTGGSIRQPASFCDVIGLKPTYGRVSRYGLIAYASSFDQIGPITRSVEDAGTLLEVIAGYDEHDSTCSQEPVPPMNESTQEASDLKVAYLLDCLESDGIGNDVRDLTENFLGGLKDKVAAIEPVRFPYLDQLVPAYQVLSTAEASSNLARYDGVHYGYQSPGSEGVEDAIKKSRTEGFGPEVKRRIMLGTFVLSAGYYEAYYGKAQKIRRVIRDHTLDILKDHDLIALPTTPSTPFKVGENVDDPVKMYLQDIFTVQANLAGIPAISLPLGKGEDGMPFGIQLMGRPFKEKELLGAARTIMNDRSLKNAASAGVPTN